MTALDPDAELRRLADVDALDLSGTRMRRPKRAVLRLLRVFSSQQAAFNRAVTDQLAELHATVTAGAPGPSGAARPLVGVDRSVDDLRAQLAWLDRTVVDIHGPLLNELRSDILRLTDAVSELTWRIERAGLPSGTPAASD